MTDNFPPTCKDKTSIILIQVEFKSIQVTDGPNRIWNLSFVIRYLCDKVFLFFANISLKGALKMVEALKPISYPSKLMADKEFPKTLLFGSKYAHFAAL